MKCTDFRFPPSKQQSFFWKVSLKLCWIGLNQLCTGYTGGISREKALIKYYQLFCKWMCFTWCSVNKMAWSAEGPDIISTEWNGIGNGSQFFIGPINKGHQKYLAAQITRHKSKSKSVNVVFRCTNTLNFQFKCCRPADKVFLLIINLVFLINVSCLNQN